MACTFVWWCMSPIPYKFMCHQGISSNHQLQKLESWLQESLRVSPDLPGGDTDSSSPPARLSGLPSEGLTPYCQCHGLNSDLFYNPLFTPSAIICSLSATSPRAVSALSYLPLPPSFTQSRLSHMTAACQMLLQLQVYPSLNG